MSTVERGSIVESETLCECGKVGLYLEQLRPHDGRQIVYVKCT